MNGSDQYGLWSVLHTLHRVVLADPTFRKNCLISTKKMEWKKCRSESGEHGAESTRGRCREARSIPQPLCDLVSRDLKVGSEGK